MPDVAINKRYGDRLINNILVKNGSLESLSISKKLISDMESANETLCIVLETGLKDVLLPPMLGSPARKYIIVPEIKDALYKNLSKKAIVREVPHIKGNYIVIDRKIFFAFDDKFNGIRISDQETADEVFKVFIKEFWENSTNEFIENTNAIAERTFDIPPIYSTENVLIDESIEGKTPIQELIGSGTRFGSTGETNNRGIKSIVIRDIDANKKFLEKVSNEKILYAPELPFCFVENENGFFILNFDVDSYDKLPEKSKGRLFAVKCKKLEFGETYEFRKHSPIRDLVGKDVMDLNKNRLEITGHEREVKTVATDLRKRSEYIRMEEDLRETRLEKDFPRIFEASKLAEKVTFEVDFSIKKRSMNQPAKIYGMYDEAKKQLEKVITELSRDGSQEITNGIKKIDLTFSTADQYALAVKNTNSVIDGLNARKSKEIDESLNDVTPSKKEKKQTRIERIKEMNLTQDLPQYGKLYQSNGAFEYILTDPGNLDMAMKETSKIENIEYLTE